MTAPAPLTVVELEQALQTAEPAVRLAPPRILRRVLKHDRQLPGLGLQVPHRKSYVIARDKLLAITNRTELGLPANSELPPTVILLPRPDPEKLARQDRSRTLIDGWRLLFHARIDQLLAERIAQGKLTEADVRDRARRLGATEFEEVRNVLKQERYLLPPEDDRTVWTEFIAVYLEIRHFSPSLLANTFPGIEDVAAIDRLVAEDVDGTAVLAATRPASAPSPDVGHAGAEQDERQTHVPDLSIVAEPLRRKLLDRANRAAAQGNQVRAAILDQRAGRTAEAEAELAHLGDRLQTALQLDDAHRRAWQSGLIALLSPASRGLWPVAARLLYDLQNVCVDQERPVYEVGLAEWALALGRLPVLRLLPGQAEVRTLKHLRSALGRLPGAPLPETDRRRLADLLHAAIHDAEDRLRCRFRPVIQDALHEVGLRPHHLPERVAHDKLIEELLDQIGERGYLTMGDLRDALSRNQLKLGGLEEFIWGDRLLLLNRRLPVTLDGIFHRGPIYMRALQRASAVAFGNPPGRFLTRFVALPFGGAYFLLEFLQHVLHAFGTAPPAHVVNRWSVLGVGLLLLGLLHWPRFRQKIIHGMRTAGRGLLWLVRDLPQLIGDLPPVRRVLESDPWRWFVRFVCKPLIPAAPLGVLAGLIGGPAVAATCGMLAFVATAVLLNTRFGGEVEEAVVDGIVHAWHRLYGSLLPNLFRWVVDLFHEMINQMERLLYAVDEQLRFRSGDSQLSLVLKAIGGLVWFIVTYIVRFTVNLLIEPQINPVKHFPVVTVSHKLVMTMGVPFMVRLMVTLFDMHHAEALAIAGTVGFLIPGMFGFLAWELKENWSLYDVNRSPALRPVKVGSHGETVSRLLRPGFHSGTIPKLFTRLRKAERRALRGGRWQAFHKLSAARHHIEEAIHRFLNRELIRLLQESKNWGGLPLQVGAIHLATNRIRVVLRCSTFDAPNLDLTVDERNGRLEAHVTETGWLPRLSPEQRQALAAALAGLCALTGVEAVAPIPWNRWVETWQRDQAGQAFPEPLPSPLGL